MLPGVGASEAASDQDGIVNIVSSFICLRLSLTLAAQCSCVGRMCVLLRRDRCWVMFVLPKLLGMQESNGTTNNFIPEDLAGHKPREKPFSETSKLREVKIKY